MCFIVHALFLMSSFYNPGRVSNLFGICMLFCFASFFNDANKYAKEEKWATNKVLPVILTSGHNKKPVTGLRLDLRCGVLTAGTRRTVDNTVWPLRKQSQEKLDSFLFFFF